LNEFCCWKFKQITKKWVSKGKWVDCVRTWGQHHILPYLSMKEGSLFCFVIMIFSKPWCLGLCYGTYHQKVLSMNRGAPTWFRMFGVLQCGIYWLYRNIFSLKILKNQDWKLYWNLGAFLVLLENPHQVWFNKVDFVILKPKMWTILLNFWWVLLLKV